MQDVRGYIKQRNNAVQDAAFGTRARHPVDGGTGFILADGQTARAKYCSHPFETIGAHSCHYDSNRAIAEGLRD